MTDDLLGLASRLLAGSEGSQDQAGLKRAVSTAYYALFHAISRSAANLMVSAVASHRNDEAWVRVYRAFDHGVAKNACLAIKTPNYPVTLVNCAAAFVLLQEARHEADYNPLFELDQSEATSVVELAVLAVAQLTDASDDERIRFVTQLLFRKR